ncbi:hypothetical protein MF672_025070 [Actinomadura sp. ATCC 31491]|uniref:Lysoplasmalogenase n=1 Tax=Actinomadura luzonensis TaxID=2805427 RepID=A0ABT0FY11_9ACTN|nr:hypothetical protein [Actinomadura luzonensis]MCK2217038.1 hypothetical protein [Actinomadura luzonensis]
MTASAARPPSRRNPLAALAARWPTLVALGSAALSIAGTGDLAGEVHGLAEALILLPLLYLLVAKLNRPRLSWPILVGCAVLIVVLRGLDLAPPSVVFGGVAAVVLVWGAVAGDLARSGEFRLQALGMLGFGALALGGLLLAPGAGRYLVAAGWALHAVWDFVHLRRGKVVVRSYAEWCGVLDVLIAVNLLLLA